MADEPPLGRMGSLQIHPGAKAEHVFSAPAAATPALQLQALAGSERDEDEWPRTASARRAEARGTVAGPSGAPVTQSNLHSERAEANFNVDGVDNGEEEQYEADEYHEPAHGYGDSSVQLSDDEQSSAHVIYHAASARDVVSGADSAEDSEPAAGGESAVPTRAELARRLARLEEKHAAFTANCRKDIALLAGSHAQLEQQLTTALDAVSHPRSLRGEQAPTLEHLKSVEDSNVRLQQTLVVAMEENAALHLHTQHLTDEVKGLREQVQQLRAETKRLDKINGGAAFDIGACRHAVQRLAVSVVDVVWHAWGAHVIDAVIDGQDSASVSEREAHKRELVSPRNVREVYAAAMETLKLFAEYKLKSTMSPALLFHAQPVEINESSTRKGSDPSAYTQLTGIAVE